MARPRRFDRIVRSGAADEGSAPELPGAEAGGGGPAELERWVGLTEGLSLAALAEAVISVRSLRNGLEETVDLLRRMSAGRASRREFAGSTGFGQLARRRRAGLAPRGAAAV